MCPHQAWINSYSWRVWDFSKGRYRHWQENCNIRWVKQTYVLSINASSSVGKVALLQWKMLSADFPFRAFFPKADANIFSLTWKLLQGRTLSNDHQNNIMVNSTHGNIIVNCWIKTYDGWEARVNFLGKQWWEGTISYSPLQEKYQQPPYWTQHPSQSITHATAKASISKSTAPSNHVKIVLWAKPNNKL